jgi:hypothetical protein
VVELVHTTLVVEVELVVIELLVMVQVHLEVVQ